MSTFVRSFYTSVPFHNRILYYLIILSFFLPADLSGQLYGLQFSSHSDFKENRTHLDLSPNHFFNVHDNFTLSFAMTMRSHEAAVFGYVVRIIDSENENVDLIYNYRTSYSTFDLVYGEEVTSISARSDFEQLSREWIPIELRYNYREQSLLLVLPDTTLAAYPVKFSQKVKILFGASDFENFKTTDVPPMNIRDITLRHEGQLIHEWKLNESAGNIAFDSKGKVNALAMNPVWLKPKFQFWAKNADILLEGNGEVAFNQKDEVVYIIGDELLMVYSVKENRLDTVRYLNKPDVLKQGCQAFYDPVHRSVVSYNVDLKSIARFNLTTRLWEQTASPAYPLTVFWHHNKYFQEKDSTLYIFGGYGQHEYKNSVLRFRFNENRWDTLITSDKLFHPRYLSASGMNNDTVFILGGYGSLTGKQILNPGTYKDLVAYSIQHNHFSLIREFDPPMEDIAFANSMVIDPDHQEFYVLAFPIFRYEGYLQLMKGRLNSPELTLAGDKIPYLFHDIQSFSDLFLCQTSWKLVCVTLLKTENNKTQAQVYTIGYPPGSLTDIEKTSGWNKNLLFLFPALFLVSWLLFLAVEKKMGTRRSTVSQESSTDQKLSEIQDISSAADLFTNIHPKSNTILFLGDFQIFNRTGSDITSKFSPLLKELFLLIWLNSIKDKGISAERIIEILWLDKDEKSARNNLAVNIVKLKTLLSELDSIELSKSTGYWKSIFNEETVYNDYWHCLRTARHYGQPGRDDICELIRISQKGHFLESLSFDWLDEFKAELSNIIIDTLIRYSDQMDTSRDPNLALHLAHTVLLYDMLNEEAILLKCKTLTNQGKHHLAKEAFDKFTRDYKNLYNIPYPKTLLEILNF